MKLSNFAGFIKSANAGPTMLTIDIGFRSRSDFDKVVVCDLINAKLITGLYPVPPERVQIYNYSPSSVIKITLPRSARAGSLDERDYDGTQQFAPLLDVEVPASIFSEPSS